MTHSLAEPLAETKSPAASVSPVSIALWLLIQLIAMALIVARVKLWIGAGDDSAALELILAMQIAGAALLLHALMPNLRTMTCVALASIPFLQIAGIIAAADTKHVAIGAIALLLWLIGLQCAMSIARSTMIRAVVHVLAMCISIGGAILFYLRAEFSLGAGKTLDAAWFGPICAALTLVRGESSPDSIRRAWVQLAAIAITMCVMSVANRTFLVARASSD